MVSIAHQTHREGFSEAYLERICPTPLPMRSLDDWYRSRNADLEALTDRELAREGRLARQRADLDPDTNSRAWFEQRTRAVDAEVQRRRAELTAELRRHQRA